MFKGSNPCSCSEVVVKAQKLPKPTYYVSPEEIKDVVIAKNIQVDCSNSQSEKNSSSSNGSNSNSCGCKNNQKKGSTSIVESESISVYTDVSTDSISSGSEVKVKSCSNNPSKSKPDCSCKKEKIETLEVEDSISFDGNVAPRYIFLLNKYIFIFLINDVVSKKRKKACRNFSIKFSFLDFHQLVTYVILFHQWYLIMEK